MAQPSLSEMDISAFTTRLQFSPKTKTKTIAILAAAEQAEYSRGKSPKALIAAALYIAGILEDEPRSLAEIGQVTEVSQNTLQKHKTQLVRELGIRKQ